MHQLNERLALVARIKPQTVTAASTISSDAIHMESVRRVLFIFNMGEYAAGDDGTVSVKITGGTDGINFATDLTGKALTTATFTGASGDDAVGLIEVTAANCATQDVTYIRAEITPANQNLTLGLVALAGDLRYSAGGDSDLAKVKEIVM